MMGWDGIPQESCLAEEDQLRSGDWSPGPPMLRESPLVCWARHQGSASLQAVAGLFCCLPGWVCRNKHAHVYTAQLHVI